MKYIILVCAILLPYAFLGAASIPAPVGYVGTWPPTWVGVTKGPDATVKESNPVEGDASHNFDFGKDEWGYWANLEVGTVIVEMRYIDVTRADHGHGSPDYGNGVIGGAFLMGAPLDEQGAREYEGPQLEVPLSDINNNRAMWVAADECSQALYQEVTGIVMDATTQAPESYTAGEEKERSVDSQPFAKAETFCNTLGAAIGKTVAIPSEKEWEFLCRSGTATAFYTGRILDGFTGFNNASLSTTISDTMYDFNRAAMDAGKLNVPNGDLGSGGITPAWIVRVDSVDGDGIAHWNQFNHFSAKVCGTLTITGSSSLGMNIVAQFDSRFQHRYAPDHYGMHAPILMLYYFDGTNYLPRPYGDPSGANMFYRLLDDKNAYVSVAAAANAVQNHNHSGGHQWGGNVDEFGYQDPSLAGDWYVDAAGDKKQLEYREMIQIVTRFKANVSSPDTRNVNMSEWDECFDGNYILVEDPGLSTNATIKRMYPIHSIYTRYRYYEQGTETIKSLPITPTNDQIEEQARGLVPDNQKGKNGPNPEDDMTVEDYVFNYWEAISRYYDDNNFNKDFYVPTTPAEIANIDKSSIVLMHQLTGFGKDLIQDAITVNGVASVTSSIAAVGRSPWGFLNMHGNLEEWTTTTWDGKSDHQSHVNGGLHVTKGGSWRTGADRCRSAARTGRDPAVVYNDVGFRFIIRN